MTKQQELQDAVKKFAQGEQGVREYMNLFIVGNRVLKQGSGLTWTEVETAIFYALNAVQVEEIMKENIIVVERIELGEDEGDREYLSEAEFAEKYPNFAELMKDTNWLTMTHDGGSIEITRMNQEPL